MRFGFSFNLYLKLTHWKKFLQIASLAQEEKPKHLSILLWYRNLLSLLSEEIIQNSIISFKLLVYVETFNNDFVSQAWLATTVQKSFGVCISADLSCASCSHEPLDDGCVFSKACAANEFFFQFLLVNINYVEGSKHVFMLLKYNCFLCKEMLIEKVNLSIELNCVSNLKIYEYQNNLKLFVPIRNHCKFIDEYNAFSI